MDYNKILEKLTLEINNSLKTYLNIDEPKVLSESMNYSMFAGGKRVRPILLLAVLSAYDKDIKIGIPYACGIEMIHTYSLIHDDLPAMDNDDYRRGKKTNHKVYGDAIAILAGDGFLTKAFEVMINDCYKSFDKNKLLSVLNISKAAGVNGMIEGQVIDISANDSMDTQTLERLQKKKTSELIRVSMETGCLLASANHEDIKKINEIGNMLGHAFQIKDDILDVTSTKEVLGKDINSDERNKKLTYISKYGLEETKAIYEKIEKDILTSVSELFSKDCFLYEYLFTLLQRNK